MSKISYDFRDSDVRTKIYRLESCIIRYLSIFVILEAGKVVSHSRRAQTNKRGCSFASTTFYVGGLKFKV